MVLQGAKLLSLQDIQYHLTESRIKYKSLKAMTPHYPSENLKKKLGKANFREGLSDKKPNIFGNFAPCSIFFQILSLGTGPRASLVDGEREDLGALIEEGVGSVVGVVGLAKEEV